MSAENSNAFRLLDLPYIVRNDVLKFWNIETISLFSLVSKKTKKTVKSVVHKDACNLEVSSYLNHFILTLDYKSRVNTPFIIFVQPMVEMGCRDTCELAIDKYKVQTDLILNKDTQAMHTFWEENVMFGLEAILNHFCDVLKLKKTSLMFMDSEEKTINFLIDYLDKMNFEWKNVKLHGKEDKDTIYGKVMKESLKRASHLFMYTKASDNFAFQFENVGKLKSLVISGSEWFDVHDLIDVMNLETITLSGSCFTARVLNEFLKKYILKEYKVKKISIFTIHYGYYQPMVLRGLDERIQRINQNRVELKGYNGKIAKIFIEGPLFELEVN